MLVTKKTNSKRIRLLRKQCFKNISALLANELIAMLEEKAGKKKRLWTRKYIGGRTSSGGSALLLKQLEVEDLLEFRLALLLTTDNFDELNSLIASYLQRQDVMRGITNKKKAKSHIDIFSDWNVLSKSKSFLPCFQTCYITVCTRSMSVNFCKIKTVY